MMSAVSRASRWKLWKENPPVTWLRRTTQRLMAICAQPGCRRGTWHDVEWEIHREREKAKPNPLDNHQGEQQQEGTGILWPPSSCIIHINADAIYLFSSFFLGHNVHRSGLFCPVRFFPLCLYIIMRSFHFFFFHRYLLHCYVICIATCFIATWYARTLDGAQGARKALNVYIIPQADLCFFFHFPGESAVYLFIVGSYDIDQLVF